MVPIFFPHIWENTTAKSKRRGQYSAVRVGEASHPGPTVTIVSHNLAGLQSHAEAAIKPEASIYAWQVSDVNLELREDAKAQLKQLAHGLQHGWTRRSRVNAPASAAGTHVSATGESIHAPHVVPSLRRRSDAWEGKVETRLA